MNKRYSTDREGGGVTSEIPKTGETRCNTSSAGHPASRASQPRYIVPLLGRGARERSSAHNMSGRSWVTLGGFTLQRQAAHRRWWLWTAMTLLVSGSSRANVQHQNIAQHRAGTVFVGHKRLRVERRLDVKLVILSVSNTDFWWLVLKCC